MANKTFASADPMLPMNYPGFVFRTLRNDGVKSEALLDGTGLTESHFDDPHFRCALEPVSRLILNAIEQTGDPNLGVRLARRYEPTFAGLPAYAAMNAPRFKDALGVLRRFFFLSFPHIEFTYPGDAVDLAPGEASIRLRPKLAFGDIEYFVCISALVACDGLCKAILRRRRFAIRAETTVRQPDGWAAVAPEAGCAVRFEANENRLVFPESLLLRNLPGTDPINHARLVALCEKFSAETELETTPVSQVISFLKKGRNLSAPMSKAAAALGYSERGLRRQLEQYGTSYRKVVDQVRERHARELLAGSADTIQAIAFELGFDTPSNFTRSFKRWTGTTPTEYREAGKAKAEPGRK